MKELLKPIFTGILSLFNVGIYLSDSVDSLIQRLNFLGLQNQANEIVHLYELIESQNQIILVLDVLRTFLMFLSLLFLFIINYQLFKRSYDWMKKKVKNAYSFITKKLKTKFRNG
jgi:hypothetical protein